MKKPLFTWSNAAALVCLGVAILWLAESFKAPTLLAALPIAANGLTWLTLAFFHIRQQGPLIFVATAIAGVSSIVHANTANYQLDLIAGLVALFSSIAIFFYTERRLQH